jgi:hypothetical protein
MSELSEDPAIAAKRLGLELVLPLEDELFIDLDDKDSEKAMMRGIETLRSNGVGVQIKKVTVSKSGNRHAYLTVIWGKPLSPTERVSLQACLGSDRKREALAMLRILLDIPVPASCFFEVPNAQILPVVEFAAFGEIV